MCSQDKILRSPKSTCQKLVSNENTQEKQLNGSVKADLIKEKETKTIIQHNNTKSIDTQDSNYTLSPELPTKPISTSNCRTLNNKNENNIKYNVT